MPKRKNEEEVEETKKRRKEEKSVESGKRKREIDGKGKEWVKRRKGEEGGEWKGGRGEEKRGEGEEDVLDRMTRVHTFVNSRLLNYTFEHSDWSRPSSLLYNGIQSS